VAQASSGEIEPPGMVELARRQERANFWFRRDLAMNRPKPPNQHRFFATSPSACFGLDRGTIAHTKN
jgi:hypothetical protein